MKRDTNLHILVEGAQYFVGDKLCTFKRSPMTEGFDFVHRDKEVMTPRRLHPHFLHNDKPVFKLEDDLAREFKHFDLQPGDCCRNFTAEQAKEIFKLENPRAIQDALWDISQRALASGVMYYDGDNQMHFGPRKSYGNEYEFEEFKERFCNLLKVHNTILIH